MSDRREFIRQATAVAVGLAARDAAAAATQQRPVTMPTASASALMALFGLKYPLQCGDGNDSKARACDCRIRRQVSGRLASAPVVRLK